MADWDRRMIQLAHYISEWSKDTITKTGCIITGPDNEIRSTGYNGLPRGIDLYEEEAITIQRPEKYFWMEHSERNAIYNAARIGTSLVGCTAYITEPTCADCARGLIQSGIARICIPHDHKFGRGFVIEDRWNGSCQRGIRMCFIAGVQYEVINGL